MRKKKEKKKKPESHPTLPDWWRMGYDSPEDLEEARHGIR